LGMEDLTGSSGSLLRFSTLNSLTKSSMLWT